MSTVEGKGGIKATIVADSVSEAGVRITTYELNYPRFIHAEFMTHRQFSRNAASSRAIPVEKMIEQVEKNPAMPIHWGANQSGMQAKGEVQNISRATRRWEAESRIAVGGAKALNAEGLHKQIVNRVLEPYQMIKVVCTATEYENFFYLRDHPDAQPEIAELAKCMKEAMEKSEPQVLKTGEWHLPYIDTVGEIDAGCHYICGGVVVSLEDAIKISASLCAQVSYRKSDESIEKAMKIYDTLVGMKPVHASPFEHQSTPMAKPVQHNGYSGEKGVTHVDKNNRFWSGNFKGWVQLRQTIPGNVYNGPE